MDDLGRQSARKIESQNCSNVVKREEGRCYTCKGLLETCMSCEVKFRNSRKEEHRWNTRRKERPNTKPETVFPIFSCAKVSTPTLFYLEACFATVYEFHNGFRSASQRAAFCRLSICRLLVEPAATETCAAFAGFDEGTNELAGKLVLCERGKGEEVCGGVSRRFASAAAAACRVDLGWRWRWRVEEQPF